LTVINANISDEIAITLILPEILLGLAVIVPNYLIIYSKTKQLKNIEGWSFENRNVVIVDTSFREKDEENKKTVISPWWFSIPLCIMVITVIGIIFKSIPPINYNSTGQIEKWGDKGFLADLSITIIQALSNLIFLGIYKWTEKAKQSLNGGKIGEIKYRSRKIRYYISVSYLLLDIYMNLLIMVVGFSMCGIVNPSFINSIGFTIFSIFLPVVIIVLIILVAAKGSNKLKHIPNAEAGQQLINRDDDMYYKFGSLYYNKNDPALFVEKRMGIGLTLNFARPAGKVIMGILVALIVAIFVMLAFIPGMTKERQVDINQNTITISGTWGTEISKDQIIKVTIENKLPTVIMKTNGADIKNKLFGKHQLEGYTNSLLFIGDKTKPFVAIYLKDGRLILINYEDKNKTNSLYDSITSVMDIR